MEFVVGASIRASEGGSKGSSKGKALGEATTSSEGRGEGPQDAALEGGPMERRWLFKVWPIQPAIDACVVPSTIE